MSDNDINNLELMDQKQVAAMLRMSKFWLERKRWEKKGIPYIKVGGRVYYDKQDVLTWLSKQRKSFDTKH